MKITIDISQAQYQGTGVGEYTYNLVHHLLKLQTNHHIQLFGGSLRGYSHLKAIAAKLKAPAKIYPIPATALEIMFNRLHTFPIELFTDSTDIYHSSDWTEPAARQALKVTTVHDITPILFPHHHHPKVTSTFKRRIDYVIAESNAIITDSLATKNDLLQHFPQLNPDSITPIHLAASQIYTNFARQKAKAKQSAIHRLLAKYHLTQPYFISLGTHEPRKNLDRVVQAFSRFAHTDTQNHSLVIAGKYGWGDQLNSIPDKAKTKINLLGFVPHADLPALISAAQGMIYPSLYEGFGLPVLEAMTLGTPVLTSKRGSLGEVAGPATILVDPESLTSIEKGFHQLLAKHSELKKLGHKQAAKFSWQKTAQQTLQVYEQTFFQQ